MNHATYRSAWQMKAFSDFAHFRVPKGYHWQEQTAASACLLALRQDVALQDLYARDPAAALTDARFAALTERERTLLLTRDAGSLQVAAKGIFNRSSPNHPMILALLKQKPLALALLKRVRRLAREEVKNWLQANGYQVEWGTICEDVGFIKCNYLFSWTGVYAADSQRILITVVGNIQKNEKSVLYVNECPIKGFTFSKGVLQWKAGQGNPHHGFMRFDTDKNGKRSVVGKIWPASEPVPARYNFIAPEIDPQRAALSGFANALRQSSTLQAVGGKYTLRVREGSISRLHECEISDGFLSIDGCLVSEVSFRRGRLMWTAGPEQLYEGLLSFVVNPISAVPEVFGTVRTQESESDRPCYGSGLVSIDLAPARPALALARWALSYLEDIMRQHQQYGGLFLWHPWEKHNLTSLIVEKVLIGLS